MTVVPPTLVVVSGPAGCGKTTLAHALATALGCPAVCRDEIKEGMARNAPGFEPKPGDELTLRTLTVFFDVLWVLLDGGVTVVAEAAFQHKVWAPKLTQFADVAVLRIVQCHTDPTTARRRIAERAPARDAHADAMLLTALEADDRYFTDFRRVEIEAPTIEVHTTMGYDPTIEDLVRFVVGDTGEAARA